MTPADIAATVYHLLGVDPALESPTRLGGRSVFAWALRSRAYSAEPNPPRRTEPRPRNEEETCLMTPSLERLAELVRQAEAKTRAKSSASKLSTPPSPSASPKTAACNCAAQRLREVRPVRLREVEQTDIDEQHLKDLVRKLAQFKASLDPGADAEKR